MFFASSRNSCLSSMCREQHHGKWCLQKTKKTVSPHLTIDFMDDAKYPHSHSGFCFFLFFLVFFSFPYRDVDDGFFVFSDLRFCINFLETLHYFCWSYYLVFEHFIKYLHMCNILYDVWRLYVVVMFSVCFYCCKVVNFVKTFPQFNSQTHYTINTINTILLTNIFNINE